MGVNKLYNLYQAGKAAFKKQKTYGTGAISSVSPSVGNKSLSKLKITVAKTKGSAAKLKQTLWESKRKKREERFTFDKRNTRTKTIHPEGFEKFQVDFVFPTKEKYIGSHIKSDLAGEPVSNESYEKYYKDLI